MRWLTLALVTLANVAAAWFAFVPSLITWAPGAPHDIQCNACGSPEVQQALGQAMSLGRAQILRMSEPQWIAAVAVLNIGVVAVLLWRLRSNNRIERPRER